MWMVTLRWGFGLIAPVLFTTISVAIFKQKEWSKSELVVKSYIKLVAALTFVDFLLQTPSTTFDTLFIISSEHWSSVINNMSLSNELLTKILPKVQFSIFPIGVMTILPSRQTWHPRTKYL